MFNRRLLILGAGGAGGLTVTIWVRGQNNSIDVNGAKIYVEGVTSTLQTTGTDGKAEIGDFTPEDIGKKFIVRVADATNEIHIMYTGEFELTGTAGEVWTVILTMNNANAKCYLLSEKNLSPVNNAGISIYDQSMNPPGVPDIFTENGLAEWAGLVLNPGEYLFYYSDPDVEPGETPITAMSNPFDAILSAIRVVRYMFINPRQKGLQ